MVYSINTGWKNICYMVWTIQSVTSSANISSHPFTYISHWSVIV